MSSELNGNTLTLHLDDPQARTALMSYAIECYKVGDMKKYKRLTEVFAEKNPDSAPLVKNNRRRWDRASKIAAVQLSDETSTSGVARKMGIAPRLLFQWRRLHSLGKL